MTSATPSLDEQVATVLPKMTYNGAMTLRYMIEHPHPQQPGQISGSSYRVYTGADRYSAMIANAVGRSLRKLGLAEQREGTDYATPLGFAVARHLAANWDAVCAQFRQSK